MVTFFSYGEDSGGPLRVSPGLRRTLDSVETVSVGVQKRLGSTEGFPVIEIVNLLNSFLVSKIMIEKGKRKSFGHTFCFSKNLL